MKALLLGLGLAAACQSQHDCSLNGDCTGGELLLWESPLNYGPVVEADLSEPAFFQAARIFSLLPPDGRMHLYAHNNNN